MKRWREITYEVQPDEPAPTVGLYIVSITKKGEVGSVYLTRSVRTIKPRTPSLSTKYAVGITPQPDLKPLTVIEGPIPLSKVEYTYNVWVRGELAQPIFWLPRTKKR